MMMMIYIYTKVLAACSPQYRSIVRKEEKVSAAMAEMPYRPKSVFIRASKRTENIVPHIYSMPFSFCGIIGK